MEFLKGITWHSVCALFEFKSLYYIFLVLLKKKNKKLSTCSFQLCKCHFSGSIHMKEKEAEKDPPFCFIKSNALTFEWLWYVYLKLNGTIVAPKEPNNEMALNQYFVFLEFLQYSVKRLMRVRIFFYIFQIVEKVTDKTYSDRISIGICVTANRCVSEFKWIRIIWNQNK